MIKNKETLTLILDLVSLEWVWWIYKFKWRKDCTKVSMKS